MTDPNRIRREQRAQRRALSPGRREQLARRAARRLLAHPWFRNTRHIAAYLAVQGELDPAPLVAAALALGKRIYLPVLPRGARALRFAPCRAGTRLARNRYGILEPRVAHHLHRSGMALDLVLLPLVAFDTTGNRLGMGAGYYDRSFAPRLKRRLRQPRLIGLGYTFQQVARLTARRWDVPLDAVVTERRLLRCRPMPPGSKR
jgi:5-formyltetrahydrofolate cyclo-ligase